MEAKLCPDGSAVGRTGPNCEFALCPGESSSGASEQSVTDGTIRFSHPAAFALAVTPEQVLAISYIPPCEQGFAYCLYLNAPDYSGTNFESAGVGITKRTDLTEKNCLSSQPDGAADIIPVIHRETGYATSLFAPLSDAAAGHYANERVYRLSVGKFCYDIRERIGQTRFENYEAGTIQEFTAADEQAVQARLDAIVRNITLANGTVIVFAHS